MTDEATPLDHLTVQDGRVVADGAAGDAGSDPQRDRVESAVRRLYDHGRFHRHFCGILRWTGRRKGLASLQVDPADADLQAATEVVYRRLMDGPLGSILEYLSDDAVEDLVVVAAGLGPVALGAAQEIADKKRGTVDG